MSFIFGLMGRGFSRLGAAGKGKPVVFGPTHPYTYFYLGF